MLLYIHIQNTAFCKIRPLVKKSLFWPQGCILKRVSKSRVIWGRGYIYRYIYIYIYSQYCWFTLFITGKSSIVPNHQPVLLLPQSVDPLPTQYQRPHQSDVFSSPRRSESSAVAPSCGNCDVHERRGREQIEMPLSDLCRICMGSIGDLYGESFVC